MAKRSTNAALGATDLSGNDIGNDGEPRLDPSIVELAAVLEEIAAMDALPLAPSPPPRRRRRRCVT